FHNGATTGGGVWSAGELDCRSCTVANNYAVPSPSGSDALGGGLYVQGSAATLDNTIVAGNTQVYHSATVPLDIDGEVSSTSDYNLIGVDTGLSGFPRPGPDHNLIGWNGIPIDPKLGPLQ